MAYKSKPCALYRPEDPGCATAIEQPESTSFVTITSGFVTAEEQPERAGFVTMNT